ncbi:uncharacterized [Tachysurus ichikawai]
MTGEKNRCGSAPWTAPLTSSSAPRSPLRFSTKVTAAVQHQGHRCGSAPRCLIRKGSPIWMLLSFVHAPGRKLKKGHLLTLPLLAGLPPSFGPEGLPLDIIVEDSSLF